MPRRASSVRFKRNNFMLAATDLVLAHLDALYDEFDGDELEVLLSVKISLGIKHKGLPEPSERKTYHLMRSDIRRFIEEHGLDVMPYGR